MNAGRGTSNTGSKILMKLTFKNIVAYITQIYESHFVATVHTSAIKFIYIVNFEYVNVL